MRGYIVTYRWELWLIIGIPAITRISSVIVSLLTNLLLPDGVQGPNATAYLIFSGTSVVYVLLLAVSYPRVRNLGRDFFPLLWRYVIAASVLGAATQGALFLVSVVFPTDNYLTVFGRSLSIVGFSSLLGISVLLWFARQASRLSLTHAAFLLVYSSLNIVGSVSGSSVSVSGNLYWVHYLSGLAIGLTVALVKVWLLGNFERRGPGVRMNAVIALLATLILSGYARALISHLLGFAEGPYLALLPFLGLFFGLAAFLSTTAFELAFLTVLFGLVYAVRVRPPATEDEPELETPTAELDEER